MTNDKLAITLRLISGLLFAGMVVCIKFSTDNAPTGQIVFFRSFFALIPLAAYLALRKELPSGLYTKKPVAHLMRCLSGCVAMFGGFAALSYLPIAEAMIISYLSPVLVVVLAGIFLGENVNATRWLGIGMGLTGMLVLVVPQVTGTGRDETFMIGVSLGLASAAMSAIAVTQIRNLTRTENAGAIAFYFALTCAVAGLLTSPFGWKTPDFSEAMILIGAGMFGGFAHIAMTLSFKYAEASKLAPFDYLSLVWAVGTGFVFFSTLPSQSFYYSLPFLLGGAALVAFKDGFRRHLPR